MPILNGSAELNIKKINYLCCKFVLQDWPERCCSRLSAPSLPWEGLPGSSAAVPSRRAPGCGDGCVHLSLGLGHEFGVIHCFSHSPSSWIEGTVRGWDA